MVSVKVLFHKIDLDGTSSGYIAREALKAQGYSVEAVGINYGYTDEELVEAVGDSQLVYCVDFSLRSQDIVDLNARGVDLVIIDHHDDPIKQIKTLYRDGVFRGKLESGRAAVSLVWEYFHSDTPAPWWVAIVDDLDMWTFHYPETKPISKAMSMEKMDVDGFAKAIQKSKSQLWDEGLILERYAERVIKSAAASAFYMNVDGKRALACPTVSYLRSELAEWLYEKYECDFVLLFNHRKDGFTLSLRSKKGSGTAVDEIARRFNGNGHEHAAGCFVNCFESIGAKLDDPLVEIV
ncbi:DHH family phosphoesterase [Vibrio sp. PNB22_3_1]